MVAAERAAMMAGMADLTSQAFAETRGLVNHLMLWIVVLGVGVAVLILIVAVTYRQRAAA